MTNIFSLGSKNDVMSYATSSFLSVNIHYFLNIISLGDFLLESITNNMNRNLLETHSLCKPHLNTARGLRCEEKAMPAHNSLKTLRQ